MKCKEHEERSFVFAVSGSAIDYQGARREFRGNLEQKLINGIAREVYF